MEIQFSLLVVKEQSSLLSQVAQQICLRIPHKDHLQLLELLGKPPHLLAVLQLLITKLVLRDQTKIFRIHQFQ